MTTNQPKQANRFLRIVSYVLATVALIWLGWVGVRLLQAIQNNQIRCYNISPPLTLFEKDILRSDSLECIASSCRLVTKLSNERGYMCLFPEDGIASESPFSFNGDQERRHVGQKQDGRLGYHKL